MIYLFNSLFILIVFFLTVLSSSNFPSSCTDNDDDQISYKVIERPTNTFQISTEGSSYENIDEVQEINLWKHEVLDIFIIGESVQGGTFKLDFCNFDFKLPGTVEWAPLPGEGNGDLILVQTDKDENGVRDVTARWKEAGVYDGYPIRISNGLTNVDLGRETYRIYFSKCTPDVCDGKGVIVQLDRKYSGDSNYRF